MQQKSRSPRNRKNKKTVKILVAILVLLIVAAVAIFFLNRDVDERPTVVTEDNVEQVKEQLEKPVEDSYYTTEMTVDWTFEDGGAVSSNAYVANAVENTRTVYFDVNLADTGELIYSSPYIPVGEELSEIKLDKTLSAGDYDAVVTYHLVDDDNEEITTVSVAVKIHVLN